MPNLFEADIIQALSQLEQQSLRRELKPRKSACLPYVVNKHQSLISFSSNDYLGLSNHPEINSALTAGVAKWGTGSGSAHLISGHTEAHEALEEALAQFLGYESCLLFNSGYQANLAVVSALLDRRKGMLTDKLSHASLLDGAILSRCQLKRYKHNDVDHAEALLENMPEKTLLATEGVFSMDGDQAPLARLAELARCRQLPLFVDDAHGFGVLGAGQGSVFAAGLNTQAVPVLMVTFGKAMGVSGAAVLTSEVMSQYLLNTARAYIYSTAMPPALAVAGLKALALLQSGDDLRQKLYQNIRIFKQCCYEHKIDLMPSETAIQLLPTKSAEQGLRWSQELSSSGYAVPVIRPPTVPVGQSRLRITLSAAHQSSMIESLVEKLSQLKRLSP